MNQEQPCDNFGRTINLQGHKIYWLCLVWGYGCHHEWDLKEHLPSFVLFCFVLFCFPHNFHGFEKMSEESKEVFSNLMALREKLELNLREDGFTELILLCNMRSLLWRSLFTTTLTKTSGGTGGPGKGQRETRGRRSSWRTRYSWHRKRHGDFLYLRRHC